MDDQTPIPDNQTPPPNPDEEWARKLKLDYHPEKAKETEARAQEEAQSRRPTPPPPPFPGNNRGMNAPDMKYNSDTEPMPNTYMLWSVLALVFCCFPTAVVAIIYSAQVSSKYYAKDYEGAKRCSDRAQMWIIASIVLGCITMAVYVPISLLLPS